KNARAGESERAFETYNRSQSKKLSHARRTLRKGSKSVVTMSTKANSAVIGLFFTIGLALAVVGLVLFSSRSLFHPQSKDILYFTTSLKGLNPGAPVKFRGVTIGTVK